MKILLDHNLDRRLKKHLPDHEISTTYEQGWETASNGKLLSLAEGNGFEVMLTADTNVKSQQNMSARKIAILILRGRDNRLSTHVDMIEQVLESLTTISPGEVLEIFHR